MMPLKKVMGLAALITVLSAGTAFAAVATGGVNVRTGPGVGYSILDTLSPGEHVAVTDESGGWCRINHPGPDGWVSCSYLTSDVRSYGDRYPRDSYVGRYYRDGGYDRYYRDGSPDGYDGYDGSYGDGSDYGPYDGGIDGYLDY